MAQRSNGLMVHHEWLWRRQSTMPTRFALDANQFFLPCSVCRNMVFQTPWCRGSQRLIFACGDC